ncbi:sperm acrosome membrane-associated protein 6 isoform X4 [Narcine bancroftii]|uniref:sperm acrosome membrane-associated protein 6 isoform X4 n=1 Tax=Narcine bancroftii TaxID=1343680 RepID=UPI0038319D89
MPNSPCLLILFLYLLAVTLTPVLTCYPCFAKSSEKFCTDYVGQSPAEIKTARCWYPIKRLMKERPIYWVRVVAADYKELKSIYSKALKLIKKRRREVPQESYTSLLDHVEQEVLYKVYNLKEATPCNQTCGINKAATYFDCRLCRLHDCNGIRFDCPIEDVRIKETGHVSMKCEASFPIPEISSVTWWFVRSGSVQMGNIRVQTRGQDTGGSMEIPGRAVRQPGPWLGQTERTSIWDTDRIRWSRITTKTWDQIGRSRSLAKTQGKSGGAEHQPGLDQLIEWRQSTGKTRDRIMQSCPPAGTQTKWSKLTSWTQTTSGRTDHQPEPGLDQVERTANRD